MNHPAAVVVAHPDDEILWLSTAVAQAERTVFCFGDPFGNPKMSAARRHAVAALQLPGLIDLKLPESGSRLFVDWAHPRLTETGIDITDTEARSRYDGNFSRLVEALRPVLAGCRDVYTHNPWGEYGHPEHIQVYRAVAALQAELGFTIRFSNYVSALSWPLARQLGSAPCWAQCLQVSPDISTARKFMRIYLRHKAWTWTRWHRWPAQESIYTQPPDATRTSWHTLSGERLLDTAGLRWWPPWGNAARRLD